MNNSNNDATNTADLANIFDAEIPDIAESDLPEDSDAIEWQLLSEKFRALQLKELPREFYAPSLRRFLGWKYDGEERKIPYYADGRRRSGAQGSPEDLAALASLAEVVEKVKAGELDGVNIAFLPSDTPEIVGLDFDDCVTRNGEDLVVDPDVAEAVANTYHEFSPSLTGIRAFVRYTPGLAQYADRADAAAGRAFGLEIRVKSGTLSLTGAVTRACVAAGARVIAPASPALLALYKSRVAERAARYENAKNSDGAAAVGLTAEELAALVNLLDADCSYDDWTRVGMSIYTEMPTDEGFAIYDEWSQTASSYDGEIMDTKWSGFAVPPESGARYSVFSLLQLAHARKKAGELDEEQQETLREISARVDELRPRAPKAQVVTLATPTEKPAKPAKPATPAPRLAVVGGSSGSALKKPREEEEPRLAIDATPVLRCARHLNVHEKTAARYNNGIMHAWNSIFWEIVPQDVVEARAAKWFESNAADAFGMPAITSAAKSAARLGVQFKNEERAADQVVVPCKNGYVHIDVAQNSVELRDADPELEITYALNAEYDPAAVAPIFEKFLAQALPNQEDREWVQEYVGYTLLPDARHQRALWLQGPGGNGKGVFLDIVRALHNNVASIPLDNLSGFALQPLVNASLIAIDESPSTLDEDAYKTIISGGLISIDRKFEKPIAYCPTAKAIICANTFPRIRDKTEGVSRRTEIMPFSVKFRGDDVDPMLARKITRGEIAGVLVWALEGLRRLLERGKLPAPTPSMVAAKNAVFYDTDSVHNWFAAGRLEIEPANSQTVTPKTQVYLDYKYYTNLHGALPVSDVVFWTRLGDVAPELTPAHFRKARVGGSSVRVVAASLTDKTAWQTQDPAQRGRF